MINHRPPFSKLIGISAGVKDMQTPAERRQREMAENAATWRKAKRIQEARPTGEHCCQKACPFPAVLDGECRQHAMDRVAQVSAIPSNLQLSLDVAHILAY